MDTAVISLLDVRHRTASSRRSEEKEKVYKLLPANKVNQVDHLCQRGNPVQVFVKPRHSMT